MNRILLVVLAFGLLCLGAATMSQGNVQFFTPGPVVYTLTGVNFRTTDIAHRTLVRIDSSTAGNRRFMSNYTTSKTPYTAVRIQANLPEVCGIPSGRGFLNLSGVTGTLEIQ